MSAPLLWIVFPGAAAVLLFGLTLLGRDRLAAWLGAGLALVLGLLAAALPVGALLPLGPLSFRLADTLSVLGRRFVIGSSLQPVVTLVYLAAALWFAGAATARVTPLFVPFGLGMVALMVAALSVEPFLYAALLIELAALLSIPILSPPGERLSPGVVRFLIFQTLAMPFILFAGWLLPGLEAAPGNSALAGRAGVMLGMGFAFLLAVFPFYAWMPMLAERAHPYAVGFVLIVMQMVGLLFGLTFLDRLAWLRDNPLVYESLRLAGILMIGTGGIWAVFSRHLGRTMGYAVIVETGFALLAIGLRASGGLDIFAAQLLPRTAGFWLWAVSLSALRRLAPDLSLASVGGLVRRYPFASSGLLLAHFALAGLPLLGVFPLRLSLFAAEAQQSGPLVWWVFIGELGLIISALRTLSVFVWPPQEPASPDSVETGGEVALLALGSTGLLAIGLLSPVFLPPLLGLLNAFARLR